MIPHIAATVLVHLYTILGKPVKTIHGSFDAMFCNILGFKAKVLKGHIFAFEILDIVCENFDQNMSSKRYTKRQVSMTRKCHHHNLDPRDHEEEIRNTESHTTAIT